MNNNPTVLARLKDVLFFVDTLCIFRKKRRQSVWSYAAMVCFLWCMLMFTYLDNLQHIGQYTCVVIFAGNGAPHWSWFAGSKPKSTRGRWEDPCGTHTGGYFGANNIQGVVFVHVCSDRQNNEQRFVRGVLFKHPPKGVVNSGFINLCSSFNVTGDM